MRSTIIDIAREAGVSTATVDRVLNNRIGARSRTRDIVLETAKRLGYIPNGQPTAASPAIDLGDVIRLDFVLPQGNNAFISALHAHIEQQARARTDWASDILHVPRAEYIGIDNRAAGRLAGYLVSRFLGERAIGKVALFAGSLSYRGHEERESVLAQRLSENLVFDPSNDEVIDRKAAIAARPNFDRDARQAVHWLDAPHDLQQPRRTLITIEPWREIRDAHFCLGVRQNGFEHHCVAQAFYIGIDEIHESHQGKPLLRFARRQPWKD